MLSAIGEFELFNEKNYQLALSEIQEKIDGGFPYTAPPEHVVYANYHLQAQKWLCKSRKAWDLDPKRLALIDGSHIDKKTGRWLISKPLFLPPCAVLLVDEAQEIYHKRAWKDLLPCQRKVFGRHRHYKLSIYLASHDYDDIDENIRDLCHIMEVQSFEEIKTKNGRVSGNRWVYRLFQSTKHYEPYLQSGKTLKNYEEKTFETNFNVHTIYNSYGCEPDFIEGHIYDNYDCELVYPPESTVDGYVKYFHERSKYE